MSYTTIVLATTPLFLRRSDHNSAPFLGANSIPHMNMLRRVNIAESAPAFTSVIILSAKPPPAISARGQLLNCSRPQLYEKKQQRGLCKEVTTI